ncbi:hypothetical protein FE257_004807 [Aspergillus nanangensis]|uniref:Mmc1 C-terminal domain-containing protein n=1 Tax=Aspergillus nanangensis TaxID=2582783 RepID=A0AAD4CT09_ASPNN|nr:hypothetical protein FE257_004807 [Aspergillus nanangensis]
MPPKLGGSLSKSLSRARESSGAVFYCPSCAIWRRTLTTRHSSISSEGYRPSSAWTPNRPITTSSVVHGSRHVPSRLRELYEALSKVQDVATEQVNLSRLQLALRGLESETPLIRVAVLGLNDATAARKLVRLLLADPLTSRGDWEDALDAYDADTSRGLLIRYGETSQSVPNDLLPTISVPSQILKKGNLEILVSSLGAETELSDSGFTAETFLVPTVTIQTSYSGRHNVVRYPVHRTIVCGRGVDDLLAYSGLLARSDLKNEAKSVYGAIELGVAGLENNNDRIAFVDVDRADNALAKFRESVKNATLYERGWNSSGVQPVVDWLSIVRAEEGTLDPSLRTLITSLIDAAETGVEAEELRREQEQQAESVPEKVRDTLDRSVVEWAENGHSELRSALEEGFASKRWRGLAWWKLFWRVDDVGMITSEILEKKYLRHAEKDVVWTAGRFQQAGLLEETKPATGEPPVSPVAEESLNDAAEKPTSAVSPWPTQITASRTRLLQTTVPSLQALAQRLVLFSMSTTSLASALSALTYVAIPAASMYETCTVAAVGLIYSLRRQQRKWEAARNFWEDEVREDGRMALLETESYLRQVVREGGRRIEDVSDVDARNTIARARQALEDVK